MECCSVETSSGTLFDEAAEQAVELLFQLSGRQFPGECGPKTVRPACDPCWCDYQVLSRGHIIGPWDWGYPGGYYGNMCGQCLTACSPSLIKLSGYPIREITEVKIDGDVLAASEYALFKSRYLMRTDSNHWPWSQNLTLPDTEDHTFSISYTYGADAPALGAAAAAQLACQLYQACSGSTNCVLPAGVTRITRQGLTVERLAFTSWAFQNNQWLTGISLVDAFLNAFNPTGVPRRPIFYAPGRRQYAQPWPS